MGKIQDINRRHFLITASAIGGGLAIGLKAAPAGALTPARTPAGPWGGRATGSEFTPWLTIAPDNTVTVRVATPEIGNGVMTQAAMTIAEELACDWSKMVVEYAPAARNFREGGVYTKAGGRLAYFSGRSTVDERIKLGLQVGASARARLQAAAAAEWKVAVADVDAANGILTHKPTGRTLTFGQVAAKAATVKLAAEPALKPQSAWTLLGKKSPGKLNNPAIVNGSAIYGMDVRLPNMVYAALRQSPVQGGRLKSYDAEAIKKLPGIIAVVVVDPSEARAGIGDQSPFGQAGMAGSAAQSAVAVVAEHYWQARNALEALPVTWDDGDGAQWKTTAQVYAAALNALDKTDGKVVEDHGDVSVLDRQSKVVEAVYRTPYSEHACMEPLNGTALVTEDGVEVWHPTQHSEQAFWVAADEAGVAPEKVVFHQTFVGGAFGRRVYGNDVRMVVAVAKKVPGRPVHVIWSREETTRQGRYRHMVTARLRAGLDEAGQPRALTSRVASTEGLALAGHADSPYVTALIPNVRIESLNLPLHIMTGPYRGPGYNSLAFMTETFVDECAIAAGVDPYEYRLKLLAGYTDPGWVMCLKEASSKAGWGKALPKGMGQGIAISNWGGAGKPQAGTTVCTVATVEVTKAGALRVHELDIAFDTGRILNRDAVHTELEGGAIFGLNMALHEELSIANGRIVEGNYDQYLMLRGADVPKVNIHFGALSGHERFAEIGEPPVGTVGPAVGNAIYRATGKRIRTMPFNKLDLSWA
ncbi:MAG: xanthine dehydrogenase family protein molybdopterin-binding subunit [Rhodospirillaceae bacterium]|nr:xanthine dehydrogenase family protein molybdopterin-binding subunit [Rhodospirillaceae bacterium]